MSVSESRHRLPASASAQGYGPASGSLRTGRTPVYPSGFAGSVTVNLGGLCGILQEAACMGKFADDQVCADFDRPRCSV